MWKNEFRHDGVEFPKAFDAKHLELKCEQHSEPIALTPEAEEIALLWARFRSRDLMRSDHPLVQRNFWRDFSPMLSKARKLIKPQSCNFEEIARAHRKTTSRLQDRQGYVKPEPEYRHAVLDGRSIVLQNARVDAPGIFVGRGKLHEKTGRVRRRILPEDVTLNLSKSAPIPDSPVQSHSWGHIIHDKKARWLARWKDTILDKHKYVYLPISDVYDKNQSKFDIARKLADIFDNAIVAKNLENLSKRRKVTQQPSK